MAGSETYDNRYLDGAEDFLAPPELHGLGKYTDPAEIINRLNKLESPNERLKTLWKAYLDIREQPTHEAQWLRSITIASFGVGGLLGALSNSKALHEDYARKHNAAVFQNRFIGNRHFWDTLMSAMLPKLISYGTRTSLLSTSVSLLCVSSITYRGRVFGPDWIVGFTSIGALSRLWLGPRAMAVGGLIGGVVSILSLGFVKGLEFATGYSLAQFRYMNHAAWVAKREAKHIRFLESQKEYHDEKLGSPDSFKLDIEG